MEDGKTQQQEIERLKKKLAHLSEAYQCAVRKLEEQEYLCGKTKAKGRPPVDNAKKAKVLSLYRQGNTMRQIAAQEGIAVGTVHKIVKEMSAGGRNVYVFADGEKPATIIDVCSAIEKIKIVNLTDYLTSRAFGVKENPDWKDYEEFLEDRCMPRTRYGIREELKKMGLEAYEPLQIIEKTYGRVYGDHQYLRKMPSSWILAFDEIIKNKKDEKEQKEQLLELLKQSEEEWKLKEGEY